MNEVVGALFVFLIMVSVVGGIFALAKADVENRIAEQVGSQYLSSLLTISDGVEGLEDGERIVIGVYLPEELRSFSNNTIGFISSLRSSFSKKIGNVVVSSYGKMKCYTEKIGGVDYVVMDNGIFSSRLYYYPYEKPFSGIVKTIGRDGRNYTIYNEVLEIRGVNPINVRSELFSSPVVCYVKYFVDNSTLIVSLFPGSDHLNFEVVP